MCVCVSRLLKFVRQKHVRHHSFRKMRAFLTKIDHNLNHMTAWLNMGNSYKQKSSIKYIIMYCIHKRHYIRLAHICPLSHWQNPNQNMRLRRVSLVWQASPRHVVFLSWKMHYCEMLGTTVHKNHSVSPRLLGKFLYQSTITKGWQVVCSRSAKEPGWVQNCNRDSITCCTAYHMLYVSLQNVSSRLRVRWI